MEVDLEREYGVINNEGEHMEFHSDRVFSEMGLRDVLEVVAQCCVPLQVGSLYIYMYIGYIGIWRDIE